MARSGVSEEVVHQSFERLKAAGLVYEVEGDTDGYLPARALEDITLHAVVSAVEGEMTMAFVEGLPSAAGVRVLGALQEAQRERLERGYGCVVVVILAVSGQSSADFCHSRCMFAENRTEEMEEARFYQF